MIKQEISSENRIIEWAENISTWTLLIASILSLFIAVFGIFFSLEKINYIKETDSITLLIVGLIGTALGIERLKALDNIFKELSKIRKNSEESNSEIRQILNSVKDNTNACFLDTSVEILKNATEMTRGAKESIDMLSFDLQRLINSDQIDQENEEILESKKAFREWISTTTEAIGRNQNFEYRVAYCYSKELSNEQEIHLRDVTKKHFIDAGIIGRCYFGTIKIPIGFSIMIIDKKHILISFPLNQEDTRPSNAIKVMNNAKLASRLDKWFQNCVWEDAAKF